MLNKKTFVAQIEEEGIRLDKFLTDKLEISRAKVQKLIVDEKVLIVGIEKVINKMAIHEGWEISVELEPAKEISLEGEDLPVSIVYEDEQIIVVNKPKGEVVHLGAGNMSGTLINALMFHTKGNLATDGGETRPGIVHRIDKDTSGLLIVAKTNEAYQSLTQQFSDHTIDREYKSLVWGIPNPIEGRIATGIRRHKTKRQQMTVCEYQFGKHAVTNYRTLGVFQNHDMPPISLMKFKLETGRTHQIRVHMLDKGNPLVGDKVYHSRKNLIHTVKNKDVADRLNEIDGQILHAQKLGFTHPTTGERMNFRSPLPTEFQELLDFLESHSM